MDRDKLEAALLGGIINHAEASAEVRARLATLNPDAFASEPLRAVYTRVRELFRDEKPINSITVSCSIDGAGYDELISFLCSQGCTSTNVCYYAELLEKRSRMDSIKAEAEKILSAEDEEPIAQSVSAINLLTSSSRTWTPTTIAEGITAFMKRHSEDKAPDYIRFGFEQLDKLLYLEQGDFIALGGEPSAGKTALAAQMAVSLSKKRRVGFFSFETSTDKLTDRILSQTSGVSLRNIKNNALTNAEWKDVTDAAQRLSSCSLDIIRASGMTVADIQAYSLANHYEVVIIDYLQIVRGANARASRYETVTEVSLGLHTMAQRNNMAVIALTQLSRPDKSSKNPTPPGMNDLRESGQIEQDADAVLILYYEDMKKKSGPRVLKLAKNKEGKRGTVTMDFVGETQTFKEQAPDRWIPAANATHYSNGQPIKHRSARDLEELKQFEQVHFTDEEGGNPFE